MVIIDTIKIQGLDGFVYDAPVTDNAERVANIQGQNIIRLSWYDTVCMIIPALSYVDYGNERFYLSKEYRPTRKASNQYEYKIDLTKLEGLLSNFIFFRNVEVDGIVWQEPEFALNGNKATMMELCIDTLNRISVVAKLGVMFDFPYNNQTNDNVYLEYNNSKLASFSFSGSKVSEVLNNIAEAFETEWWVEDTNDSQIKKLHFDRCELANDTYQLNDKWEDENSYYSGGLLSVEPSNTNTIPEKVYVYGSERNLTKKVVQQDVNGGMMNVSYAKRLRLNSTLEPFDDVTQGGIAVHVNTKDSSIEIKGIVSGLQDTYTEEEVYPKMTMTVKAVREEVGSNMTAYYLQSDELTSDFMDSEIAEGYPDSINPSRYGLLLDGTTLMITFTSGLLNGREFECAWVQSRAEIGIIPSEEDDTQLPFGNFIPKAGDTFVLWNLAMPQSKVALAQEELLLKAKEYVDKITESIGECKCKTDPVFFSQYGDNYPMALGQSIEIDSEVFTNELFHDAKLTSRIKQFSYKLTKPYDVTFTLSNARTRGLISTINNQIDDIKHENHQTEQLARSISRRQWHDIEEMMTMIDSIKTQMLVVGNEHDNFVITSAIDYDNENKKLIVSSGYLQHGTYTEAGDNGAWNIEGVSINLNEGTYSTDKPYYVYVKALKADANSTSIILAEEVMEDTALDYYFLVGILSSEYEDQRCFNKSSGLSIISGGTITTEQIQDANRQLIIDFSSNPPRIIAREGAEIIGNIKYKATDGSYKDINGLGYIEDAIKEGSTDINGGLVLTNTLQLKNENGEVVGGINGVEESTNNVFLWAGGSLQDAIEKLVPIVIGKDGTAKVGIMQVNKDNVIIKQYDKQGAYIGNITIDKQGMHVYYINSKGQQEERVLISANDVEEIKSIKSEDVDYSSYTNGFTTEVDFSEHPSRLVVDDLHTFSTLKIYSKINTSTVAFYMPNVIFYTKDNSGQWIKNNPVTGEKNALEVTIGDIDESVEDQILTWDAPNKSGNIYSYPQKECVFTNADIGTSFMVKKVRLVARNSGSSTEVKVSLTYNTSCRTMSEINKTIIAKNGFAHRSSQSSYTAMYIDNKGKSCFYVKADDVEIKQGSSTILTNL